jgi:glutamate mutase epsilon subunit
LKYSIIEGINFTTTDRNMVAKVVSMVAGISINNTDPTNSVNQSAIQLRKSQLTSQGWQMVGRLMNVATKAGIRWNKDTFSNSIRKEMKLI